MERPLRSFAFGDTLAVPVAEEPAQAPWYLTQPTAIFNALTVPSTQTTLIEAQAIITTTHGRFLSPRLRTYAEQTRDYVRGVVWEGMERIRFESVVGKAVELSTFMDRGDAPPRIQRFRFTNVAGEFEMCGILTCSGVAVTTGDMMVVDYLEFTVVPSSMR